MIQPEQYQQFLKSVANDLEGDWLVIGGSLLAIIQSASRSTVDIDLCPINEMTNELRLSLMNVAQKSGISVESINPAADFFLKQIPNWKNSIILHISGAKGHLYRPSFELYLKLKVERLTQTDFEDCLLYYQWNKKNNNLIDLKVIQSFLDLKIKSEMNTEKLKLLENLKTKLT
jgi:hypothetical protein